MTLLLVARILGRKAGNSGTNDLTTGANNIVIGYEAAASAATVSNEITLGNTSITKFRIPGINVTLKDNGGTPTNGHVLTVDANGEAGFAAAGGGVTVQEEGSALSTSADTLNFVGSLITASGGGATKDITVAGDFAVINPTTNQASAMACGTNSGAAAGSQHSHTSFGYHSLKSSTSGDNASAFGARALENDTTGIANCAVGSYCLQQTTTGSYNTAIGTGCLEKGTTASRNVGIGHQTGYNNTGADNVFIGEKAGRAKTSGANNIIIGSSAEASSNTVSNEITLGTTNSSKFRVPGINFIIKDSTATEDYVLTVDANGEAGWEAAAAGGGPTGGGSDEIFTENDQTMTTDYTITNNKNAMAAGPITINNGITLTIGAGEAVTIV